MKLAGCLLVGLLWATLAHAQTVYYPGSVWSSSGRMLTPTEPHNWSSTVHAEQGIAYRGAELYGVSEFWMDKHRLDWNRRNVNGLGLRFTQTITGGMVRAGLAYLADHRRLTNRTHTHGFTFFVEHYSGWGQERPYAPIPTGGR